VGMIGGPFQARGHTVAKHAHCVRVNARWSP
jgi:hypothetical protein